jgi:hypothetical protein
MPSATILKRFVMLHPHDSKPPRQKAGEKWFDGHPTTPPGGKMLMDQ